MTRMTRAMNRHTRAMSATRTPPTWVFRLATVLVILSGVARLDVVRAQTVGRAATLDERLEKIAGIKPAEGRAFLGELQRVTALTDRLAVCALVQYPLRQPDGPIVDAAACQRRYAEIFTADVIATIKAQAFEQLFVNAQGAMLGDGQVWFAAVCQDRGCARTDLRVIAVNHEASVPGRASPRHHEE